MNNIINIANFKMGNNQPLVLIAGPCQIESMSHALEMADFLTSLCKKMSINFIYKSSFDKANRTSANGKRGVGLEKSLEIFKSIKDKYHCPILTDVHHQEQCAIVAPFVDILQIPALLSRQTDLLEAAALTGKVINVKKGQFMAPGDMVNVVKKLEHFGNNQVTLTDRGACFGYNNLVSDMRCLPIMAKTGAPVIFDATHSVQKPSGLGDQSGGEREFVPVLSRSATAAGIAGLFLETHQDPDNAPSDGSCMLNIKDLEQLLKEVMAIDKIVKS
ncbi:2-dehydro-3-deoxyphosphooctonate aldolase [Candidatus Arcanobacter lacustris]|jgi:2-dehydro-3-deoxyphosphooctonate aldolase (KDO 8-P synthase)|uniref:2-dehydro-3-deoxyphosphooctonate aldolase n=1 Tax=Candidatus Arcanibacter lacustris TaxID=1607817 RepID=A0A0F5MQ08_9RICK|nr:2-dehydro-3-deoxyphosphooctonate aldolase [Candidatus Arcanobacter lacustris]